MSSNATTPRILRKPPFAAPNVFVLTVVEGDDPTQVYRIQGPDTVIGRGEDADLNIDNEDVSKEHCVLRVSASVCTVQDLASLNGTSVNGRKLRPRVATRIRHMDEILIGDTRLILLAGRFKPRPPK